MPPDQPSTACAPTLDVEIAPAPQAAAPEPWAPKGPGRAECSTCHLRDVCLPGDMSGSELDRLDSLKFTRRKISAGRTLYMDGDVFRHIYAVHMGTLKSSLILADGREQVSGFHVAGDVVGLDGLARGLHASATMALEDTELCAIPYAHLSEPGAGAGGMQRVITRLMSREIQREHSLMLVLGSMTAEERLAHFVLNLSQRYEARGYPALEFQLRMSRAEIGSYLGIKLETVSRTFSVFQQQRLLQVRWRHVRIIDLEGLKRRSNVRIPTH